jgi:hypothetical protein
MKYRPLATSIIALALTAAPVLASQGGTQTPPPTNPANPTEKKPDAKPATLTVATLAGKWNVSVDAGSGPIESTLEVKADANDPKKFTGSITSQMGDATLKGEVVDGKVTFSFTMNGGSGEMSVAFTGTQQKDGSLAGTLNFGQGDIAWTAVKAK